MMLKRTHSWILLTSCFFSHLCSLTPAISEEVSGFDESSDTSSVFYSLCKKPWVEVFSDPCDGNWRDQWFLDGDDSHVANDGEAITIDTSDGYAVLWTKPSFEGDLRIEYDFQRVDTNNKGVNIIYIQATGDGQGGNARDIGLWSDRRSKARMSDYFNNMHTYHISYAAWLGDYVRARRYQPLAGRQLGGTELKGEYLETGLFEDQQWIHVTIIKHDTKLWIEFKHPEQTILCSFTNDDKPPIQEGRIGLRMMPQRESRFKNFRVMQRDGFPPVPNSSPLAGN